MNKKGKILTYDSAADGDDADVPHYLIVEIGGEDKIRLTIN